MRAGWMVGAAMFWVACGGYNSPGGGGGGGQPAPAPSATITITSAGFSPTTLSVSAGSTVVVDNRDSAGHQATSNPHPVHTDCPEFNAPVLQPGQTFTATASTVRSCG